jgi:hypothetical protein
MSDLTEALALLGPTDRNTAKLAVRVRDMLPSVGERFEYDIELYAENVPGHNSPELVVRAYWYDDDYDDELFFASTSTSIQAWIGALDDRSVLTPLGGNSTEDRENMLAEMIVELIVDTSNEEVPA